MENGELNDPFAEKKKEKEDELNDPFADNNEGDGIVSAENELNDPFADNKKEKEDELNDPFADNKKEKEDELNDPFADNNEGDGIVSAENELNDPFADNKKENGNELNDPFAENKKAEGEEALESEVLVSVSQRQDGRSRDAMVSRSFTQSVSLSSSQKSSGDSSRSLNSFPSNSIPRQSQSLYHSDPTLPMDLLLHSTPQPQGENLSLSQSSSISMQEDRLRASLSRQEAVDSLFSNSNSAKRTTQIHKQPRRVMSQQESLASLRAQKDKLNPFAFVSSQSLTSPQSSPYSSNCNSSRSILKSEQPIEDVFKGIKPTNLNDIFSSFDTITYNDSINELKQQNPQEQSSNKPVMIPDPSLDNPFKTSFDELDNPFGGTGRRPTSERGSNLSSVEDDVVSEIVPSDLDDAIAAVDQTDGGNENQKPSQSSDQPALGSPRKPKTPRTQSVARCFRISVAIRLSK